MEDLTWSSENTDDQLFGYFMHLCFIEEYTRVQSTCIQ